MPNIKNPLNATEIIHRDLGEKNTYYRFFISPITPSAKYCFKDNKFRFSNVLNTKLCESSYKIENKFNIQALISTSNQDIIAKIQNRSPGFTLPTRIIVDIPTKFADEYSEVDDGKDEAYAVENEKLFGEVVKGIFRKNGIRQLAGSAEAVAPVYSQKISINQLEKEYDFLGGAIYSTNTKKSEDIRANPLVSENNSQNKIKFIKYNTASKDYGHDVLFGEKTPMHVIGCNRTINGISEWYNLQNSDSNKKSYPQLTGQIYRETGMAIKIANLFDDYAKKGTGFSALIHFHMFRHDKNIQKAKEIAKALRSELFSHASNTEIADYLVTKFYELNKKEYKVNQNGSFARRMNYAIAQLTDGMFYSVNEYESTMQKDKIQNRIPENAVALILSSRKTP